MRSCSPEWTRLGVMIGFWFSMFVILVGAIILFGGVASGQPANDSEDVINIEDNSTEIDVVERESSSIRIGDVEMDEDSIEMTIKSSEPLTKVTVLDQAEVIGANQRFITTPKSSYLMGDAETIRISVDWHHHSEHGNILVVNDGEQSTTFVYDGPGDDDLLQTVGPWTWVIGAIVGLGGVVVAGYVRKRREYSQPHQVM